MRRACAIVLGALLVAASPALAAAQGEASTLVLAAPEGCPGSDALAAEVASLVGREPAAITLPAGLDPRVVITAEGGRYVLAVTDAGVTRTLRDRSCVALVRAAALIVALRIDADAATLAAASAAELAPTPVAPPAPARPVVPAPPPRSFRPSPLEAPRRLADPRLPPVLPTLAIGAGGIVEAGVVPVVSGSVAADLVARVDRFEARARGAYVFEQGQQASYGVAASAIVVTALGCGRPFDVGFAIAFCGGLEGGPLFARSYGVTVPGASTSWAVSAVVGAWLPLFPWHGVDVSLGAEVFVRLYRPEFAVEGLGVVWDADLVGGRFGLLVHLAP